MALGTALFVGGCGEPADEGFDSGFSEDRLISSLSAAEADAYCDASLAYLGERVDDRDFLRLACTAFAISVAEDRASCEALVTRCLTEAGPVEFECVLQSTSRATCSLPLSVATECIEAQIALFEEQHDAITCALAGTGDGAQIDSPAACERLEMECPLPDDAT